MKRKLICANLCVLIYWFTPLFLIGKSCPDIAIGICYLYCLDFHLGRVVGRNIILIKKDISQQYNEAQDSWCWLTGAH